MSRKRYAQGATIRGQFEGIGIDLDTLQWFFVASSFTDDIVVRKSEATKIAANIYSIKIPSSVTSGMKPGLWKAEMCVEGTNVSIAQFDAFEIYESTSKKYLNGSN